MKILQKKWFMKCDTVYVNLITNYKNTMKKIDINITEAKIKAYSVNFTWDIPSIDVTLALLTNSWKEISTFSLSTNSWSSAQFDLDLPLLKEIEETAKELERIATIHCSSSIWELPSWEDIF